VKLSDFDFSLPDHLIAQHPLPRRDQSRLMLIDRSSGRIEHRSFRELPHILGRDHFLVINSSRVFPARLWACRPQKSERIEILLVQETAPQVWKALVRPARKAPPGQLLNLAGMNARVEAVHEDGSRILRFQSEHDFMQLLNEIGEPPLPPYIRRAAGADFAEDRQRYQTVYARRTGSVAAPTAGLHFTPEILKRLRAKGIPACEIVLHVGYGTFKPVRCRQVEDHLMDPEYFEISLADAQAIDRLKAEPRKLVAVGSTVTRVMEHVGRSGMTFRGGASGWCDLFIYPGHEFCMVDCLLTNFHLPRSTLFILVCAFAGGELVRECYRQAIEQHYRFFSYGDCMLIL